MQDTINDRLKQTYDAGFTTNVESDTLPPGLNEDVVRKISKIKNEPKWLLDFRLRAYDRGKILKKHEWANLDVNPIDYEAICNYSAPRKGPAR